LNGPRTVDGCEDEVPIPRNEVLYAYNEECVDDDDECDEVGARDDGTSRPLSTFFSIQKVRARSFGCELRMDLMRRILGDCRTRKLS
jgi:hypothetical protein